MVDIEACLREYSRSGVTLMEDWAPQIPPTQTIDPRAQGYDLIPFIDWSGPELNTRQISIAMDIFVFATGQTRGKIYTPTVSTQESRRNSVQRWLRAGTLASNWMQQFEVTDGLDRADRNQAVFKIVREVAYYGRGTPSFVTGLLNQPVDPIPTIIERYAPLAPIEVKREAGTRLASWLANRGPISVGETRDPNHQGAVTDYPEAKYWASADSPNAMRSSGAEQLLAPFRCRGSVIV